MRYSNVCNNVRHVLGLAWYLGQDTNVVDVVSFGGNDLIQDAHTKALVLVVAFNLAKLWQWSDCNR